MANRRKFLAGIGALASGSAAAVGTGAFTSVQANRDVNVSVAGDSDALLALTTDTDEDGTDEADNAEYVNTSGGQAVIDINGDASTTGTGVNADATTQINDLFKVVNQGTQPVVVYVDPSSLSSSNYTQGSPSGIAIDPQASNRPNGDYQNTDSLAAGVEDDQISLTGNGNGPDYSAYQKPGTSQKDTDGDDSNDDGTDDALEEFVLKPGESFDFGLYVTTDDSVDGTSSITETIEIVADATLVPGSYVGKNN